MPLPTPSRLVPLCSAESLKLARSFTDTPRRWLMSLRLSAASMLDLAKAAKPAAERPAPMPMVPIRPRNLAAPASSPRMLRAAESNAPLVSSLARIRICAKSATGQLLLQDLLAIVMVFGARLHGLHSYKKVLRDAALQKDPAGSH